MAGEEIAKPTLTTTPQQSPHSLQRASQTQCRRKCFLTVLQKSKYIFDFHNYNIPSKEPPSSCCFCYLHSFILYINS